MKHLADIGCLIEVIPNDIIWIKTSELPAIDVDDLTPFRFRVEGWLEDGQIFYGLWGHIHSGPERYQGLVCNITVRIDACDWRIETASAANFKVGPSPAFRNHEFDFRHPHGIRISGFPVIGRYASVRVVEETI